MLSCVLCCAVYGGHCGPYMLLYKRMSGWVALCYLGQLAYTGHVTSAAMGEWLAAPCYHPSALACKGLCVPCCCEVLFYPSPVVSCTESSVVPMGMPISGSPCLSLRVFTQHSTLSRLSRMNTFWCARFLIVPSASPVQSCSSS